MDEVQNYNELIRFCFIYRLDGLSGFFSEIVESRISAVVSGAVHQGVRFWFDL